MEYPCNLLDKWEQPITISKAKVESLRAQNCFIQVWDYDAGFPGIQNDDYLGRWFSFIFFFPLFTRFSFFFFHFPIWSFLPLVCLFLLEIFFLSVAVSYLDFFFKLFPLLRLADDNRNLLPVVIYIDCKWRIGDGIKRTANIVGSRVFNRN